MRRLLIACLLAATSLGCGERKEISFATVGNDWFNAPITIAQSSSFSGAKNVAVKTFDVTSGLASKNAVLSRNADIGLSALLPILTDRNAIDSLLILGCYMRGASVIGLVSQRADNSNTAAVLPPIAYVKGTISEVYLIRLLQSQSEYDAFHTGKLTSISVRPPDIPILLANKSVNSAVVWDPYLTLAAGESIAPRPISVNPDLYTVNVCLLTSRDRYSAKRGAIDAVVKTISEASSAITSDKDGYRTQIEKLLSYKSNLLSRAWNDTNFSFRSDVTELDLMLRNEVATLNEVGLLQGDVTYSPLLEALRR